jgi:predicted nucleotidyltransferase
MSSVFLNLLKRLNKAGVDFVIVGGFAGVVHGCTFVTQDIDVCCDFSPANLFRLQKALTGLHPIHRMTPKRIKFQLNKKNVEQFENLYLDTDIGQLDCLSQINGLGDFSEVKKSSVPIEAEGMKFYVLNIEALIKSKKAMGRQRDKQAIQQLEEIKRIKKKSKK